MIALAVVIVIGVYYIVFDVMQYRVASPAVRRHRPHAECRRAVRRRRRDLPGRPGGHGHRPRPESRTTWPSSSASTPGQHIPDNGRRPREGALSPGRAVPRPAARPEPRAPTSTPGPSSPPTGWSCPLPSARRLSTSAPCSRASTPQDLQTNEKLPGQRLHRYGARPAHDHRDRPAALQRAGQGATGDGEPRGRRAEGPERRWRRPTATSPPSPPDWRHSRASFATPTPTCRR